MARYCGKRKNNLERIFTVMILLLIMQKRYYLRSSWVERFYLLVWIIAFCIFTSVLAVALIGTDSSIKGAAERCDLLCPTDCLKPKHINFGASYHQAFYFVGLESYHFILESDTDHYRSCKNFKE